MIIFCGSQAQISAKETRFAQKISSDIRSAAGELFIGPSQSLPEMSDGPTAIGEHCTKLELKMLCLIYFVLENSHNVGTAVVPEKRFYFSLFIISFLFQFQMSIDSWVNSSCSSLMLVFCLILFFMFHQQSFK